MLFRSGPALGGIALSLAAASNGTPSQRTATTALSGKADAFDIPPPIALPVADRKMIYATAYVVHLAVEAPGADDPIVASDQNQGATLRVPRRDWCLAADEGSLRVTRADGTHLYFVYAGTTPTRVADCSDILPHMRDALRQALEKSTFKRAPADAPFGTGGGTRYRLLAYRSIAVGSGPSAPFHTGDVVFIPALRGQPFRTEDGTPRIHDGYVAAVDSGGAIAGSHIDFFKGPAPSDAPPAGLRSDKAHLLPAYLVRDPAVIEAILGPHERRTGD